MSSLQKIPATRKKQNGRGPVPLASYRKQFVLPNGSRAMIYLGRMSKHAAEEIDLHVERLIGVQRYSTRLDVSTEAWLQSLSSSHPKLLKKLNSLGLCAAIQNPTVAEFVDSFMSRKKATVVGGTFFLCEQVAEQLKEFFPPEKRVCEVTTADAKQHWHWLITSQGLGENTAKRRLGRVREVFAEAVEIGLIVRNPFVTKSLPVSVGVGKKDYVAAETIQAVIDYLPADKLEWKLLLAFGRFVGCRMPSEIRNLKRTDVNWEHNTILLHSPKTARKGKPDRLVPIFPEIRDLLLSQLEAAEDGEEYVFPTLRNHSNTATTAAKFVAAAGFGSWPKFWNSLRASRETDLMDSHGLRLACSWIGNTAAVAMKHYALIRKTDYTDVGKSAANSVAEHPRTAPHSSERGTENPINPRDLEEKLPRMDSNHE
jgi:integrase